MSNTVPQLAIWALGICGVHEDSAIEQCSMHISDHAANVPVELDKSTGDFVPWRVWLFAILSWALAIIDILRSWLRPIRWIAFIDRVDCTLLLHFALIRAQLVNSIYLEYWDGWARTLPSCNHRWIHSPQCQEWSPKWWSCHTVHSYSIQ